MSSTNHSSPDAGGQEPQTAGGDQEHAGHSGEGAASALAQLKTQTRQHRRLLGEHDDSASGGHPQ